MKRTFGTWATRVLRGGCTLTDGEYHVLSALVSALPASLRETVETQFAAYNLAQREIDRRALNFYRIGRAEALPILPIFERRRDVTPLIRITFSVQGELEPLHAVLTAVHGRAFSVSFSRPVARSSMPSHFSIEKVTQAWRSNVQGEQNAV